MLRLGAAAGLAASILLFGASAHSAEFLATFTGTIEEGSDVFGAFGAAGDLSNQKFQLQFLYDPSLGIPNSLAGVIEERDGGTRLNAVSPILDVAMTINGVTVHSIADLQGSIYMDDINYGQLFGPGRVAFVADSAPGDMPQASVRVDSFGDVPFNLHTPFETDLIGGASEYTFSTFSGTTETQYVDVYLGPSHLSVTEVANVPEPQEWGLLLFGLGGVGGLLRSRKQGSRRRFA